MIHVAPRFRTVRRLLDGRNIVRGVPRRPRALTPGDLVARGNSRVRTHMPTCGGASQVIRFLRAERSALAEGARTERPALASLRPYDEYILEALGCPLVDVHSWMSRIMRQIRPPNCAPVAQRKRAPFHQEPRGHHEIVPVREFAICLAPLICRLPEDSSVRF
jgi:hypothetical protein